MASLTGVMNLHQHQVLEMMKFAVTAETNLIVLGPAGGGKTEMAFQAAKEIGYESIYVDLSVLEAPDFVGLPTIEKNAAGHKFVEYATPKFMPCKDTVDTKQKPFVMIFDELDKSRPELQAPLLEIFQNRSINGRPLHISGILATGNLPDEGAFSQPISHALTNRCSVYKMDIAFDTWQQWAVSHQVNPLVVAFLSKNPDLLLKPPPEGDPTAYCHASPRAWTNAASDLTKSPKGASVDLLTQLVAGRVGGTVGSKFYVWLQWYREVEPHVDRLVFEGKPIPDMTPDKLIVAAISACHTMLVEAGKKDPDWRKNHEGGKVASKENRELVLKYGERVFEWLSKQNTEYQLAALKNSIGSEALKYWQLTSVPAFMKIIKANKAVIFPGT